MTFENILLEKKNSIAYVTVNRPKVLNALNMATMEEVRIAFTDIQNDAAIRVVILTGSGEKAFIPGPTSASCRSTMPSRARSTRIAASRCSI
jgi:enoyl-CoA hydratase